MRKSIYNPVPGQKPLKEDDGTGEGHKKLKTQTFMDMNDELRKGSMGPADKPFEDMSFKHGRKT